MKKGQFLIMAIVVALVVAAAFPVCLDYMQARKDQVASSGFSQAIANAALPSLSESAAPSPASAPEDHSDNTTVPVTSSGVVRASFTVVSEPPVNQEESAAAVSEAMPNNQAHATPQGFTESGRPTPDWVLATALFSMVIAAAALAVFRRLRAKEQTHR